MRIGLGSDEDSPVVHQLVEHLSALGHDVQAIEIGGDWPLVGRCVGDAVAASQIDVGIVCCTTGTGVSIAANKVAGVRAALCSDAEIAVGARRWNNANVLALSLLRTTPAQAVAITDAFLSTAPDDSERRLIGELEP